MSQAAAIEAQPTNLATSKPGPRAWRWMLIFLLIGLALRLAFFCLGPAGQIERGIAPDSSRYMLLSDTWLQSGHFGLTQEEHHESSPVRPFHELRLARGELPARVGGVLPELLRTPGYPAFLAGVRGLGAPWQAVLVVQILLSASAAALVFLLVGRWLGSPHGAALVAAAIMALAPADIIAANMLLTEPLYDFLFLLAMVLLLARRQGRPPWSMVVAAGGLLGLATLVRPVGLMIGPAIAAWYVLTHRNRAGVLAAALLAGLSLLGPVLWAAHNAAVGAGLCLSNVATVHMAKTAALMEMRQAGQTRFPEDFQPHYQGVVEQVRQEIRPGETVDAAASRICWQRIGASRGAYVSLMAASASKFMLDHSVGDLYRGLGKTYHPTGLRQRLLGGHLSLDGVDGGAVVLPAVWTTLNALLALLAAVALVRLALARRWGPLGLLTGCFLYFILATQYQGMERMRLPVLWVQAALVGCAFWPNGAKREEPASTSM